MSTGDWNLDERMNKPPSNSSHGSDSEHGKQKKIAKAKVLVHRFKNTSAEMPEQSSSPKVVKLVNSKKRSAEVIETPSKKAVKRMKWSSQVSSQFGDGRYIVLVVPKILRKVVTEEVFVCNCQKSQMTREGVRYGKISRGVWFLKYRTQEEASLMAGRKIEFTEEIGIERSLSLSFISFHQYDSRTFFTTRVGPYDDPEIQALLEAEFPGENYWMGGKKFGEFLSEQRLLIFESPQYMTSFELGAETSYLIQFKKLIARDKCIFCSENHVQGSISCQLIVASELSNKLKNRLTKRP